MQLIQQIDNKLTQTLPYYSELVSFTTQQCKISCGTINKLYQSSTNQVKKMSKASKQFKKDLIWMISQSTEDFLEFVEEKLDLECPEADEKNKTKRAINIYNQLKNKKLMAYVNQFITFNKDILQKGRIYGERHFLPLYVNIKATVLVSKQILMEIFNERLGQLRMTYKCHKDTIAMFWSGEFKEQKVIQKIKENFGTFKQFTVNFVQKGLEIKISKKDLTENYHNIMNMLSEILKGVGEKGIEQWTQTKTKTVNLYTSVLDRIREKQIQIRIKMLKERSTQNADEQKALKQSKVEDQSVPKPQNSSISAEN